MLRASHALSATMLALLAAAAAPAHAIPTVTGVATNLADTTAGQDLWRFDFTLDGAMATGEAVRVFFGTGAPFSNLTNLTPSLAGAYTTAITTPFLQSTRYTFTDAGTPALSSTFALSLVLAPSASPLTLAADFVAAGSGLVTNLPSITVNLPTAPVPEPSTYALMALGLLAIGLRSRARKA